MNLGKGLITAISVIAKVVFVLGAIFIIVGLINIDRTPAPLIVGVVLLLDVPFLFGFRYIVMAACRYLELHPIEGSYKSQPNKVSNGIKVGDTVTLKSGGKKYKVIKIEGGKAYCVDWATKDGGCFPTGDLILAND